MKTSCFVTGLLLMGTVAAAATWEQRIERANALQAQGRYAQAIGLYGEAMREAGGTAGAEGTKLARAMTNFGAACYYLGHFSEAEALYRRALAAWGNTETTQRDRAFTLNNLATLYRAQGCYREAEAAHLEAGELFSRSRADSREVDLGTHLNNLAELYRVQGRLDEAAALARRSADTLQAALGPVHPKLAGSLHTLGAIQRGLGRFAEAEALYRRAQAIHEHTGITPAAANTMINLAELYAAQKRYSEANLLASRALNLYETSFGPEHPNVALALNNLAQIAKHEGRGVEAEALYRRCLRVAAKTPGAAHPDYARYTANFADLYFSQGRYRAAEVLYGRAIAVMQKALGGRHPELAAARARLARVYQAQNRPTDARKTISALRPSPPPNPPF